MCDRLVVVMAVLAIGCSQDEATQVDCPQECLTGTHCQPELQVCLPLPGETAPGTVPISPVFDARVADGHWHVLLYDQLWGRFLYGRSVTEEQNQDGQPLVWETVALARPVLAQAQPQVKVVVPPAGGEPLLFAEVEPGNLELLLRSEEGWTAVRAVELPTRMTDLDILVEPDLRTHYCLADQDGLLHYGVAEHQAEAVAMPILAEGSAPADARAPCRLTLLGGSVTALTGRAPAGLLSLARKKNGHWSLDVLDEGAVPADIRWLMTDKGLLTLYLDRKSGELRQLAGEGGKLTIQVTDATVVEPDSQMASWQLRISMSAQGPGNKPYLAYFHHAKDKVLVQMLDAHGKWGLVSQHATNGGVAVPVVAQRPKAVELAIVQPPGQFSIVEP